MSRIVAVTAVAVFAFSTPASAEPGRLLASTAMLGAPGGATAWRIRYETRDQAGRPTESTAMVIAPVNAPGSVPAPRDAVAWNHGTVGIAEACAPSAQPDAFASIPQLAELMQRGYVVVATDYPGLGTRGPHGYLVGQAASNAIWDGLRAARRLDGPRMGNRVALWGHSQGGHASLWATQRQRRDAPEFVLVGTAAISPPTDLPGVLAGMDPTAKGILTAYVMQSWSRVYGVPLTPVVDPRTAGIIGRATQGCVGGKTKIDQLVRVVALKGRLAHVPLARDGRWGPLLRANSVETTASTPLMVVSATADKLINDAVTKRFVAGVRVNGGDVTFVPIQGGDHGTTAIETGSEAVDWIRARFASAPRPQV